MIVNRRAALKQFLVISAGAALLPSCLQDQLKATILLKNFQIDGQQEKLLAELAETIIPATSTPGAKDVSAHLFALKMLDDCYSKGDQQKFLKGLQQLDETARTTTGQSFLKCTPAQRDALVSGIENRITAGKGAVSSISGPHSSVSELDFFYSVMKRQTILAYSSSQFFLTKIHVYELVPGRYHGCVPVKNIPGKDQMN
ncbi:MAG TPA: gluconate 2-dehydrogenase subunit 3 family protein [Puia sp.]|nr:gluconate 2-dehydrogenase subunit 3 family protein [Puia sp.]